METVVENLRFLAELEEECRATLEERAENTQHLVSLVNIANAEANTAVIRARKALAEMRQHLARRKAKVR